MQTNLLEDGGGGGGGTGGYKGRAKEKQDKKWLKVIF